MRPLFIPVLLLGMSIHSAWAATPPVVVQFTNPDHYSDASLRSNYQRGADPSVLKALRAKFEKLGSRYLQPGQQLQIEVRNIDLAGRFEPWNYNANDVRFMREITWPSIDLHYVLSQDGKIVRQADARISDKAYLQRPGRTSHSDRLYSEKAMLDDWFRQQFKPR
ncbi:DUF3016 domain-containing protein [Pseudomonas sp. R5(2019)]|uniref:DUF3016 domain-containing protein n=1 Tax=Pseudomonas sp. R5(2019) TaxID=2697566 RepID=UPI00141245B2|nr:DUF3016 domain-containing protein [Pseudomonas sp. R5(2019)]NBA96282.1 DUF3016 domain-containing protein [Pseudomonas sp. R5(2019)]